MISRRLPASSASEATVPLGEGTYLGSQSTFYRLLRAAGETRERRRQAVHPAGMGLAFILRGSVAGHAGG